MFMRLFYDDDFRKNVRVNTFTFMCSIRVCFEEDK